MSIARFYDASKNPDGRYFIGVPQGDVDQATWDSLPQWLQDSVDADPAYRKTALPKQAKPEVSPPVTPEKAKE